MQNRPNFSMSAPQAILVGRFILDSSRAQWLIDRTRQWCFHYARHDWLFRINSQEGTITFEFADPEDGEAFRRATSRSPTLLTCV